MTSYAAIILGWGQQVVFIPGGKEQPLEQRDTLTWWLESPEQVHVVQEGVSWALEMGSPCWWSWWPGWPCRWPCASPWCALARAGRPWSIGPPRSELRPGKESCENCFERLLRMYLEFSLPFCVKLVSTSDILDQFLNNNYVKAKVRLSYFLPTWITTLSYIPQSLGLTSIW